VTEAIACATLLVRDYDEAIDYFTNKLGFALLADALLGDGKRWVVVAPERSAGMRILLARASTPAQEQCIGNQTGGRVSFFLETDDFARTHAALSRRGVRFLEEPRTEAYGTVAVFADLYGNKWDLLEPRHEPANEVPGCP
jgi:catechol 2,3-dioxygenase-like lactoylglutathione lyase family enzyme